MHTLWIQNVRHYKTMKPVDILLRGETVALIRVHEEREPDGARLLDGRGLIAAPGLVALHVHLRDPGQTEKEDLSSGCRAAAAGGVTSLLAMPNTLPAADTPERVRDILTRAEGLPARVYLAAAISKGLDSNEMTGLSALMAAGAIALSDDGKPVGNSRMMADAMIQARELGLRVAAHCEDLDLAARGIMNEGAVSRALGVQGIPAAAEDAGTAREIALAAAYGVPVHICHVSTKTSVALIRDAKARGVPVTAETAPHYLLLTDESLYSRDADYRMNPPLRTEADRTAIVEALCDGTIDCIATDHAPHTTAQKSDFLTAPNGVIGMETSFAACFTALVESGKMTLPSLIRRMSSRPAQILDIPAGQLEAGANADLILLDEREQWLVDPARFHGKSRNTPFKGMKLTGKIKATFCRGRAVFEDQ